MAEELIKNDKEAAIATAAIASMQRAEEKRERTPLDEVEETIADFTKKAMTVAMDSSALTRAMEQDFIEHLPEMKMDEKITLYNIHMSSSNDKLFKLLSPTFGAITSRQQAEIQAQSKKEQQAAQTAVQVNVQTGSALDSQVAAMAPPEVRAGLNTLNNLLQAWGSSQKTDAVVAEVKDAD